MRLLGQFEPESKKVYVNNIKYFSSTNHRNQQSNLSLKGLIDKQETLSKKINECLDDLGQNRQIVSKQTAYKVKERRKFSEMFNIIKLKKLQQEEKIMTSLYKSCDKVFKYENIFIDAKTISNHKETLRQKLNYSSQNKVMKNEQSQDMRDRVEKRKSQVMFEALSNN